jgi:hypothetical protein
MARIYHFNLFFVNKNIFAGSPQNIPAEIYLAAAEWLEFLLLTGDGITQAAIADLATWHNW